MEAVRIIFSYVKQMAFHATFVILAVMAARLVVGRVSKQLCYLLWGIVALRLCCPVLPVSEISIFRFVPGEALAREADAAEPAIAGTDPAGSEASPAKSAAAGTDLAGSEASPAKSATAGAEPAGSATAAGSEAAAPDASFAPPAARASSGSRPAGLSCLAAARKYIAIARKYITIARKYIAIADQRGMLCMLWLTGLLVLTGYAVAACVFLHRKLRCAVRFEEAVCECEHVRTPFVFGTLRPVIYLPLHLTGRERAYVLAHERYHLRRKDHLVKWFAFALLAVYWFHPLVWLSYVCMSRDMELSCDDHVLKNSSEEERKEYSRMLLRFSCEKQVLPAAGPCFGAHEIRQRIRHALAPKKRAAGAGVIAGILLILLAAACLTNDVEMGSGALDPGKGTAGTESGEASETMRRRQAEALFAAANPYIGDAPADGRLLNAIWEVTGDPGTRGGMQLQTTTEPYGITIHFEELPDRTVMWNTAVLFLALTENCGEFGWDFELAPGDVCSWTVPLAEVSAELDADIKSYAASAEGVEELLRLLEEADPPDSSGFPASGHPSLLAASTGKTVFPGGIYHRDTSAELINELLPRLPEDPALAGTDVLILRDEPEHMELWEIFYQKVQIGVPADLLLAYPYSDDKEEGYYYAYVSYDGEAFYAVWNDMDIAPDAVTDEGMAVYQGKIYSNLLVESYEAQDKTTFLTAVLDNDPALCWDDIVESWLSSVAPSDLDVYNLFFVEQED